MYQRDVPKIKAYVEENGPDGLVHVGAFVLATIRMPFSRVAPQVQHIKEWGIQSPHLWGFKSEGYRHLQANRLSLYQKLVTQPVGRSEALLEVSKTPGLGLVKAGFLLQCLGYEVSCLDVHNVRRYGIDPNQFKGKITTEKANQYLSLCDSLGSSEKFWNDWCEFITSTPRNKVLGSASDVSAYHFKCVSGVT